MKRALRRARSFLGVSSRPVSAGLADCRVFEEPVGRPLQAEVLAQRRSLLQSELQRQPPFFGADVRFRGRSGHPKSKRGGLTLTHNGHRPVMAQGPSAPQKGSLQAECTFNQEASLTADPNGFCCAVITDRHPPAATNARALCHCDRSLPFAGAIFPSGDSSIQRTRNRVFAHSARCSQHADLVVAFGAGCVRSD